MNESYQHPGKWHDLTLIPTMVRSDSNHFVMSHLIKTLDPNSVYEAIVQAKNQYGWNEVNKKKKKNFLLSKFFAYFFFFFILVENKYLFFPLFRFY